MPKLHKIHPLEPKLLHALEVAVEMDLSTTLTAEQCQDILDAVYGLRDRVEALEARLEKYEREA